MKHVVALIFMHIFLKNPSTQKAYVSIPNSREYF